MRFHTTEIMLRGADGSPRMLWRENLLGRLVRKFFDDFRHPLLGSMVPILRLHNSITNAGHAAANGRISNQGGYSPFVNLAIGIGVQEVPATATVLASEITTGGGGRQAAVATQVMTTVADDTTQLVATWTFGSAFAITEEGVFDDPSSGGTMLAYQSFAAINVVSTDQLTVTHKVQT